MPSSYVFESFDLMDLIILSSCLEIFSSPTKHFPLRTAPEATVMVFVLMSPKIFAVAVSSRLSFTEISPRISPETMALPAETLAVILGGGY